MKRKNISTTPFQFTSHIPQKNDIYYKLLKIGVIKATGNHRHKLIHGKLSVVDLVILTIKRQ